MPVFAVVACVAIVAVALLRGKRPSRGSARQVNEPVAAAALVPPRDSAESRLARIQNAVDAIAIEVERISENQRFLTKVLASDSPRDAQSSDKQ